MALILRQTGVAPLGQFDFLDADLAGVTGGEMGEFSTTAVPSSDKAAADQLDSYVELSDIRTLVRLADGAGPAQPLLLLDDGSAQTGVDGLGYTTLFGSAIGGTAGQATQVSGATVIGPPSYLGSGKVTCWYQPGLFATNSHALTAGELGTPPAAGAPLYAQAGSGRLGTTANGDVAAYFVRLATDDSLVSTSFSNVAYMEFLKA
jgi:hypothetical protein